MSPHRQTLPVLSTQMIPPFRRANSFESSTTPTSCLSLPPLHGDNSTCEPEPFGIAWGIGYWKYNRSRVGSPFDSSDSDSSSDSGDDTSSVNLSLTDHNPAFSRNLLDRGSTTIRTITESNALGLVITSESDFPNTRAISTSRPQAESLRVPHHHQDNRSCDCSIKGHHERHERLAHQPNSPADETLASERPQDICLQRDESNTSGPKMLQGLYSSRQQAHLYPGFYEPRMNSGSAENWLGTRDQGQGATTGTRCTCVADIWPCDCQLQHAPRMRPVPLPKEEGDEHLLCYGSGLGGRLADTLDGVPNSALLDPLDVPFPVPFSMGELMTGNSALYAAKECVAA
ncbi:hypothetical protein F5148DRAFT_1170669 [Russula earlei]|uniref:Uncharacterized protein n=1 Tax=Russula earlei TaxID=71964 RepID=A0ACC0UK34_9AGAM|nr:hypothetical protein F5148DRAFT_1170669 [Russula earlei]